MSITKELRGFADDLDWHMWSNDDIARKLRAIADNIDAEHERRMEQAKREVLDAQAARRKESD